MTRRARPRDRSSRAADSPAAFDVRTLRRMAGPRSFARGEEYVAAGQVRDLTEQDGTIEANVQGTRPYRVTLRAGTGDLDYACTCPVGWDGAFCKHGVAVGLAWLARAAPRPEEVVSEPSRAVTDDEIRAYLGRQHQRALIDLLMGRAVDDPILWRRLAVRTARHGRGGVDFATYRDALISAIVPDDFVPYGEMYQYAEGVDEALRSLEGLIKDGHAPQVMELAEDALAAAETALEMMDDSDGYMGGILQRLQDIHLEACVRAKPDPEALARRLFEWELSTEWDTFSGASETYADLLGPNGLAVYRELAEAEWAGVPGLGPGDDTRATYDRKRFRITGIMETLARHTGDVEAVVAVQQRDLSTAYDYLQIAETYREAGKADRALEWAERGVAAFPQGTDPRLREFLAEEYHRCRRHADAVLLAWATFTDRRGLEEYRTLKAHADRAGAWPSWREKALAHLRETIARALAARPRTSPSPWREPIDRSELVRIYLWEKDVEAAWREAQEGGCSPDLWLRLAAKREGKHPADALPIYQAEVETTLARKNNDAYREAIGLLRKVRQLMIRTGGPADFATYLDSVRTAHKPKRNFQKLLSRARWE